MNQDNKSAIVTALEAYIQQHQLSQNEVAERAGVNPAYIIQMRKGDFTIQAGKKRIPIGTKYFNRIATYIGYSSEKQYWPIRETPQLKGILAVLQDAKYNAETAVIIGETGCGKTYVCELFQKKHPSDVFYLKVGASDTLSDLIDKILIAIGAESIKRSKSARIRQITHAMRVLSEKGKEPMIIFDEAEYMKQPALCALKELYDNLNDWCALVLIGTDQLVTNIERLKKRNKAGIPQLYRRIRYRVRPLTKIDRRFKLFISDLEPGLKRWLQHNCDNYGELHDVLVPAMREAERLGESLDEDFVKMTLGINN